MACMSEYQANGSAIAATKEGAKTEAINNAKIDGALSCSLTGSCPGLNQECGFTPITGSGSITEITGPDGKTAYQATITINGKCECKTVAQGT